MIYTIILLIVLNIGLITALLKVKTTSNDARNKTITNNSKIEKTLSKVDVRKFYDEQTDNFLKVYGNVIQAFRTKDVNVLLDYQITAMGLKKGMRVLDAGCGVCGPAIYFAKQADVEIDAITISSVQQTKALKAIEKNGLNEKIKVKLGDYHHLQTYYPKNSFDLVYFLESFGHAENHQQALDAAWEVLKPGGTIFIKDLFIKKTVSASMKENIDNEIAKINTAYHYNVPDLNNIVDFVRSKGYILSSLKTIDIPLQDFENLSVSNQFQELTGINKIENLREYVFPVDFFEIKCMKPSYDTKLGTNRYFLQNLYFIQIENWKEKEL
jgi:ubiquinone/menaquinone biosynthesis C-methylase UbiE